ncbi:sugar kinase [Halovulum dunhuangense]|uniref:Sugar kinase n=1 Tax=Halovulum dunhuangense TaxID=1505036 RepID=A0A849L3P7_9RHOB|nr:PfkB family carbohydrate kinase [Halovulum dunhuangense]NNU80949.1 sugar kinase [Halovulum dunhuangense]
MTEVLVCGSAVIDMIFEVDRFPDRAEKYRARDARILGGGCAANAAVAITRLGGRARIAARCGDDLIGRLMREGLEEEGVDTSLVQVAEGGRSAFSSIQVTPDGERQIMAFRGAGLAVDLPAGGLGRPDAVLADTRWPEAGVAVLDHARALGVPGILDGEAPVAPELLRAASHAAFSAQGLRALTGRDDLAEGLRAAAAMTDAWVCVTDGARGTHYLDDGRIAHVPSPRIVPVDTLGAGDVWHGAFALALGEGMALGAAIAFGNAAASLKCTVPGGRAGAPDRAATEAFMQRNEEWN